MGRIGRSSTRSRTWWSLMTLKPARVSQRDQPPATPRAQRGNSAFRRRRARQGSSHHGGRPGLLRRSRPEREGGRQRVRERGPGGGQHDPGKPIHVAPAPGSPLSPPLMATPWPAAGLLPRCVTCVWRPKTRALVLPSPAWGSWRPSPLYCPSSYPWRQ